MNTLSLALGSLGNGAGPASSVDSPAGSLLAPSPSGSAGGAASGLGTPSRDSAMPDQASIAANVNLLQQAASSQTDASAEDQLSLPALPTMPAPAAAAQVPTDDHGQSNIVFSDADGDGSLIHETA